MTKLLVSESAKESKKCNIAVNAEKEETSGMSQIKDLLKPLNERMDHLEKQQEENKPV